VVAAAAAGRTTGTARGALGAQMPTSLGILAEIAAGLKTQASQGAQVLVGKEPRTQALQGTLVGVAQPRTQTLQATLVGARTQASQATLAVVAAPRTQASPGTLAVVLRHHPHPHPQDTPGTPSPCPSNPHPRHPHNTWYSSRDGTAPARTGG
jgi:hypothetical protein